jgi:hypothetical protein
MIWSNIITIGFIALLTFRPIATPDTEAYVLISRYSQDVINSIENINLFSKYGNIYFSVEYGYLVLCSIINRISSNYRFLFFVVACFTTYMIPAFLSKLSLTNDTKMDSRFIRLCYIATFGLLYSGVALRSGIAISLGLVSVYFAQKRKWIPLFIFSFLAFTIQRSSLLLLLISLAFLLFKKFSNEKSNKRYFTIALLGCGLLIPVFRRNISKFCISFLFSVANRFGIKGFYESYISDNFLGGIGITKSLVCLLLLMTLFIVFKEKKSYPKPFLWVLILPIYFIVLFYGANALSRLYDIALILILPILYDFYIGDRNNIYERGIFVVSMLLMILISINTCFVLGR